MSIREAEAADAIDREVAEATADEEARIERRAAGYRRRVADEAASGRLSTRPPSEQNWTSTSQLVAAAS